MNFVQIIIQKCSPIKVHILPVLNRVTCVNKYTYICVVKANCLKKNFSNDLYCDTKLAIII